MEPVVGGSPREAPARGVHVDAPALRAERRDRGRGRGGREDQSAAGHAVQADDGQACTGRGEGRERAGGRTPK